MARGIFGISGKGFDEASGEFMPIDVKGLEKEIKLEDRAKQQGEKNIPSPTEQDKDDIATDVDSAIANHIRKGKADFSRHLDGINSNIETNSVESHTSKIKATNNHALTYFFQIAKDGVGDIYPLRKDASEGENALEKYRKVNKLAAPAEYPDNAFGGWLIIIIFFLVESLLNGWILGDVHPEAVLGAYTEAFIISVFNVVFGMIIAFMYRRTNFVNAPIVVMFFWVILLSICLMSISFNLCVGHYRDVLEQIKTVSAGVTDETVLYKAWAHQFNTIYQNIRTDPLTFSGIMAPLLLGLGVIVSGVTAYKVYKNDDSYPNYGSRTRTNLKRFESYNDVHSIFMDRLSEHAKTTNTEIEGLYNLAVSAVATNARDHQQIKLKMQNFDDWIESANLIGKNLYAKYRSINKQNRSEGTPKCFEIGYALPEKNSERPAVILNILRGDIESVKKIRDDSISILHSAQNQYIALFRTLGQLAPESTDSENQSLYDDEVGKIHDKIQAELKETDLIN